MPDNPTGSNFVQLTLLPKNPLEINEVIQHLLRFLSVKEIKICRLVSHQWSSNAELALNKKSTIHFKTGFLRPSVFLAAYDMSPPEDAFTGFKFSNRGDKKLAYWHTSELESFFVEWGHKIKKLELQDMRLKNSEKELKMYYITHWIESAPNLVSLTINWDVNDHSNTKLGIRLEQLKSIKYLSLTNCVLLASEQENELIRPIKISLDCVALKRKKKIVGTVRIQDFFDFSRASRISHVDYMDHGKIFDMESQVFKAHYLYLMNSEVVNWAEATGQIDLLHLTQLSLIEKNQLKLKIKELIIEDGSIDLAALPTSIEKIRFVLVPKFICRKPIHLPNIKYLQFHFDQNSVGFLSHFTNCANLTELELSYSGYSEDPLKFNLNFVPKSVKKMKIVCDYVQITGRVCFLQLETLIVQTNYPKCLFTQEFESLLSKIKSKVLVVAFLVIKKFHTSKIVQFIQNHMEFEKIIVASSWGNDLHVNTPFEGSDLSQLVDTLSNFYLFENQVGKALTWEEFRKWSSLNGIDEQDNE